MKQVLFYFDPVSPYPYFAWKRIPALIARNSVTVEAIPILFAGLLNTHGQKGPAEIPAKKAYVWREVLRWGKINGIPLKGPTAHPFNPLSALRVCEAVADTKQKLQLAGALLEACWKDGKDLSNVNVLKEIADQIGLNGGKLILEVDNQFIKEQVKKNTQQAIDRGVFGVPTFWVNGEIFWGHDRMEQLELYLQGKLGIDEKLFNDMMRRPRAAERKCG